MPSICQGEYTIAKERNATRKPGDGLVDKMTTIFNASMRASPPAASLSGNEPELRLTYRNYIQINSSLTLHGAICCAA